MTTVFRETRGKITKLKSTVEHKKGWPCPWLWALLLIYLTQRLMIYSVQPTDFHVSPAIHSLVIFLADRLWSWLGPWPSIHFFRKVNHLNLLLAVYWIFSNPTVHSWVIFQRDKQIEWEKYIHKISKKIKLINIHIASLRSSYK